MTNFLKPLFCKLFPIVSGALALTLVFQGCVGSGFDDTDPGGEIRFYSLYARDGFIYSSASFYNSTDQWQASGAVHFDAERLFIQGEDITHSSQSDAPNVTAWALGGTGGHVVHHSDDYAVVSLDSNHNDAKLQVYQLDGIFEPLLVNEVAVSTSALPWSGTHSLGQDAILVSRFDEVNGVLQASIYAVSSEGNVTEIASSEEFQSYGCQLEASDRMYCIHQDSNVPAGTHYLRVYQVDRLAGEITLIGEVTNLGPNLDSIRGFSILDNNQLAVFGDASANEVELFDLDTNGVPVYRTALTRPGQVYVYDMISLPNQKALAATSEGVHLVDLSNVPTSGTGELVVLATYPDTPFRLFRFDQTRDLYMWPLGRWGMVVVRVTDGDQIEKVGGYYRKFGDSFGTYGRLSEGKY